MTLAAVYAPLAFTRGAPGGCSSNLRWRWRARVVSGFMALTLTPADDVRCCSSTTPSPTGLTAAWNAWLTGCPTAYGRLLRWVVGTVRVARPAAASGWGARGAGALAGDRVMS